MGCCNSVPEEKIELLPYCEGPNVTFSEQVIVQSWACLCLQLYLGSEHHYCEEFVCCVTPVRLFANYYVISVEPFLSISTLCYGYCNDIKCFLAIVFVTRIVTISVY